MVDASKTIFISYRRTNSRYLARAIFEHLQTNGYDVFLDIENIDSGEFERIILGQIAARQHFLVLLTVGTMERCAEPSDWLRREVEYAIKVQRNIIPIMVDEFSFTDVKQYLTGDLANLEKYNAFKLYYDYFDEGMSRLRGRFLRQPFEGILSPITPADAQAVERKIAEISAEPIPTPTQLTAEEYFNRAKRKFQEKDFTGTIADLTEAVSLNPQYIIAYTNRGVAYKRINDLDMALKDFSQAIQLDPRRYSVFYNRGRINLLKGDNENAISDFTQAIKLNENFIQAYTFRSKAYTAIGNHDKAKADHDSLTQLKQTKTEMNLLREYEDSNVVEFDSDIQIFDDDNTISQNMTRKYFAIFLSLMTLTVLFSMGSLILFMKLTESPIYFYVSSELLTSIFIFILISFLAISVISILIDENWDLLKEFDDKAVKLLAGLFKEE